MGQGLSQGSFVTAEAEIKLFLGRVSLLLPLRWIAAGRGRKMEQAAPRQHQEPSPVWMGDILPHFKFCKWQVWGTTEYGRTFFLHKWEERMQLPRKNLMVYEVKRQLLSTRLISSALGILHSYF